MTETKDVSDKTLRASGQKAPSVQRTVVESGHVRQNVGHGRSNVVVVETRKTRKVTPPGGPAPRPGGTLPQHQQQPQRQGQRPQPGPGRGGARPDHGHGHGGPGGGAARSLSEEERARQARALAAAKEREAASRAAAERAAEEARRQERERLAQEQAVEQAPAGRDQPQASPAVSIQSKEENARAHEPGSPATAQEAGTAQVQPQEAATSRPAPASAAMAPPAATPDAHVAPSGSYAPPPEPRQREGGRTRQEHAPLERPRQEHGRPGGAVQPAHGSQAHGRPGAGRPASTGFSRPAARPAPGSVPSSAASAAGERSEGARARSEPRKTFNPALMPRTGGKPKQIEIPVVRPAPAAVEPVVEVSKPKRAEPRPSPSVADLLDDDDLRPGQKRGKASRTPAKAPLKAGEERRERVKLTINNAFDQQQRERSLASLKRRREREKLRAMGVPQPREKIAREVVIPEAITIQELANRMTERAVDVIKFLMKQGAMQKITDIIDADTAELIAREFGHTPKRVSEADIEVGFLGEKDTEDQLQPRAPVVTIMGHVDHGKTSLLDAIRQTNVAGGEAGGITQHIGAYQVTTPSGGRITFIDTPGHAAFTAMRARGAKVTDIVVLVVAADDGVMPQTVEAINHAKAADVPLIVAINKIDKPQADPNRVRTELLQHGIVVESMSGDTLEVPVSALQRTNLDKLLEAILLQAEILDLKANPSRSAEGTVIEAKLERGRGPVGTVLVQRGTLRVGDIVVAGMAWGRVRALIDEKGRALPEAGPSVPVEILGFDSAPEAGDAFAVVESEARARELTEYRLRKRRETLGAAAGTARTLEQMMQQLKEAGKKEFALVVKGDVQGSVEAITGALKKLGTEEVEARIVHAAVGGITESDIALANASDAVVVGFNVRANAQAKAAAESQGVEIRYYNIIYDLVDDVKAAMSGLLAPTLREIALGKAEILEVFNISKVGKVAGCRVVDGKVERGAKVRLIRDNVVIHEGTLSTLKRFKDEVREVPAGQECGMAFANWQDIRQGDTIECYNVESIARTL